MKTKIERKGKKPAKTAKAAARVERSTIEQVVMDVIMANGAISNEERIGAVKAQFPKSAFGMRPGTGPRPGKDC